MLVIIRSHAQTPMPSFRMEAAADPVWRALLHAPNDIILIKDEGFLLSGPDATPQTELQATISALHETPARTVCRFPARYLWLREQGLVPESSLAHCLELVEFRQKAPLDNVSMVLASEVLSQPASTMGHAFLKVDGITPSGQHLAHAISFFTEPVGLNIPRMVYDGLVGGMPGYFSLAPMQEVEQAYVEAEGRNLWIYPLKLDAVQRRRLQAHLVELKQTKLTYYFQSFNCATLIKHVIAVGQPLLLSHRGAWDTPRGLARQIKESGIADSPTVHASNRWSLRALQQGVPGAEVERWIHEIETGTLPITADLADQRSRAFIQRLFAKEYIQYRRAQDPLRQEAWRQPALEVRSALARDHGDMQLDTDWGQDPAGGPAESRWGAGYVRRNGRDHLRIEWMPASHRILEVRPGSDQGETSMSLLDLSLLQRIDGKGLRVDRALLYGVESLMPADTVTGGWSGRLRMGFDQQPDARTRSRGAGLMEGALGLTTRLATDIDGYVMASAGLGWRQGAFVYANPEAGLVVRQLAAMRARISITAWAGAASQSGGVQELRWVQEWPAMDSLRFSSALSRRWARGHDSTEWSLQISRLF